MRYNEIRLVLILKGLQKRAYGDSGDVLGVRQKGYAKHMLNGSHP